MNCGMNASSSDASLRRRDPLCTGRCLTWSHLALSVAALVLAGPAAAHAQLGGIGFGAVGGISIDADGIVRNLDPQAVESLARERRQALAGATDDRGTAAKLRKVSLAKIVKAVTAATTGKPLPPDMQCKPDEGFVSLFDGTLRGWRENDGARGHWVPQDWVLAYDGHGDMLWNERELRDFELICDWRWTGKPVKAKVPVIRPDGTTPVGDDGKQQMVEIDDFGDSGIYLRGSDKSQINIWCWPIGSGEVYGYRNDPTQPAAVRAGVTPKEKADAAPGKWNRFRIRLQGDRLTVNLNGKTVVENAQLPGLPNKGPIALQHHGAPIEFANIYLRELKPEAPKSE